MDTSSHREDRNKLDASAGWKLSYRKWSRCARCRSSRLYPRCRFSCSRCSMACRWRIYAYICKRRLYNPRGKNSKYNWTIRPTPPVWRWCRWPGPARNRRPECWSPGRRKVAPRIARPRHRMSRRRPTPTLRKNWTADGRYAVAVGAAKRRTRAPTACDDVAPAPGSRVSRSPDVAGDAWCWCAGRRDDRSDTGRSSPPAGAQSCSRASPDRSQIGANRSFFSRSRETIEGSRGSLSSLGLIERRPRQLLSLGYRGVRGRLDREAAIRATSRMESK